MYLCTYSRQQIRDFQEAPSFHVPPKNLRTEQLVINESFMVLSIYEFEKLTALPQRWQSKEEAKYGCLNNRVGWTLINSLIIFLLRWVEPSRVQLSQALLSLAEQNFKSQILMLEELYNRLGWTLINKKRQIEHILTQNCVENQNLSILVRIDYWFILLSKKICLTQQRGGLHYCT